MTDAQRDMLKLALRLTRRWECELGQLVMEQAGNYDGGLAWRIADRTAGALLRRGWLALNGDLVSVTDEGRAALSDATLVPYAD